MKSIASKFVLCVCLIVGALHVTAEEITPEQRRAIVRLVQDTKKAYLAKDYETFVGLLHPDMVKAGGGKEKVVELMKTEEEKNVAAGMVIESWDLETTSSVYSGPEFVVTFLPGTMITRKGTRKLQSKSFFVAFSRRGSNRWYLLDGIRLTKQQFHQMFHGLPADLSLPTVERKFLD